MTEARPKIILDCDPGVDDAFAILTAARYADVVALTSVNGNVNLDLTTRNALIMSQVAGLDVDVHRGAVRPLVVEPGDAAEVHGDSGLDGPVLPELTRTESDVPAVEALLDLTAGGDVTVVPVGPLTNIAHAIERDPGFATRVPEIVLMGASDLEGGNVTAGAEFNIWADPHAAHIVFTSGARIRVVGLDLTHQVCLGKEEETALRAAGTETAIFAADLLGYYADFHEKIFGSRSSAMHDPVAVLAVTHPHLFGATPRHLAVETDSELTRGVTILDKRPTSEPPNCEWIHDVDAPEVVSLIMAAAINPAGPAS